MHDKNVNQGPIMNFKIFDLPCAIDVAAYVGGRCGYEKVSAIL
jgi:hypothetical protein